jgi:phage virion morphogenesis protein
MTVRIVGDLKKLNSKLKALQKPILQKAAKQVGEALVSSTIRRFAQQRDPEGRPWKPLSAVTIYGALRFTKKGQVTKRSERQARGRLILIQSASGLRNSISSSASGSKAFIGTNVKYARIHQLGGDAGRGKKVKIPARPFLGVSDADQQEIVRIVTRALEEA